MLSVPKTQALLCAASIFLSGCASQDPYVKQSELKRLAADMSAETHAVRAQVSVSRESVHEVSQRVLAQARAAAQHERSAAEARAELARLHAYAIEIEKRLRGAIAELEAIRRQYGQIELVQLSSGEVVVVARGSASK